MDVHLRVLLRVHDSRQRDTEVGGRPPEVYGHIQSADYSSTEAPMDQKMPVLPPNLTRCGVLRRQLGVRPISGSQVPG